MDIVISEEQGVRNLHFGSPWIQGAMRIARPYALELEYTREMMASLLFTGMDAPPRRALMVGLGVGALPKFVWKHCPACTIDVVEIEPAVHVAAIQHFKWPRNDPRLQVHLGCGAEFMAQSQESYDLVLIDGFDHRARVGPLNTVEFYSDCAKRLGPQGYLAVNLLSNQKDFKPGQARLNAAFEGRSVFLPPCDSGNVIALAHNGAGFEVDAAELNARVDQIKATTGLNLKSVSTKLKATLGL